MRFVQKAVLGISLWLLGVHGAQAGDSKAAATPSPSAVKAAPTATVAVPAAAKVDTKPIKDAIVGHWKSVDDGEIMELEADGNARVKNPNAMFIATYKILDDGNLHLEVPAFGKQKDFIYKLEMKGDQITLTLKDQKARRYERVK